MSRGAVLLRGLVSLVGILLIVVGLPVLLAVLGGNPLPSEVPSVDDVVLALSRPDDGTLLIGLLTILGWVVWATLALSFLLEIPAALRGVPAPRLPGLSWQQGGASAMTGAVAAMLTLGVGAAPVEAAPAGPAATSTATATPGAAATTSSTVTPAAPVTDATETAATDEATVTVRSGDTLWEIAEEELGSGDRYTEIARASQGIVQPDGQRLADPDVIHPGWHVSVPGAASEGDVEPDAPATEQPSGPTETETSTPTGPEAEQATTHLQHSLDTGPAGATVPVEHPGPRGEVAEVPEAAPAGDHDERTAMATNGEDRSSLVPAAITGLGSIACAGVIGLLARRRSRQERSRRPGWRIAMPTGSAARSEAHARAVADHEGGEQLDRALRELAVAAAGVRPSLRAARLAPETIEIYVVEEDLSLPGPWRSAGGGTWILERSAVPREAPSMRTPWPALVSVGHDEDDAQILLNLEQVAALGLTGDEGEVDAVLAALAVDLVTADWAGLQVTVVGAMEDLVAAVAEPRFTHAPDLRPVLERLERSGGPARPEVLLVARPVGAHEATRLRSLLSGPGDGQLSLVTKGDRVSEWSLSVRRRRPRAATLSPVGMTVDPPRLTSPGYRDLLELLRTTGATDVPGPTWGEPGDGPELTLDTIPRGRADLLGEPAPEQTTSIAHLDRAAGPVVRVLGEVEVAGALGASPRDVGAMTEVVTLLALHPGAEGEAMAQALSLPPVDLDLALQEAVRWLGTTREGAPFVVTEPGGNELREVLLDWQQVRTLVGASLARADSTSLRAALSLVTGAPLSGADGGYAWAEADAREICAAVADIAHELSTRCLRHGDARGATWAADKGLLAAPVSEHLWRDSMHAAWQAERPEAATDVVTAAKAQLGQLGALEDEATRIVRRPPRARA